MVSTHVCFFFLFVLLKWREQVNDLFFLTKAQQLYKVLHKLPQKEIN